MRIFGLGALAVFAVLYIQAAIWLMWPPLTSLCEIKLTGFDVVERFDDRDGTLVVETEETCRLVRADRI